MAIETTGKLYAIFDTKQVSERFTKREFVVEVADNPKYPQHVMFQLTGDRCSQLDGLDEGDEVRVEFSLRGRKWDGPNGTKFFTTLDVWRVEAKRQPKATNGTPHVAPTATTTGGPDDDIPFGTADMAHDVNPIARVLR